MPACDVGAECIRIFCDEAIDGGDDGSAVATAARFGVYYSFAILSSSINLAFAARSSAVDITSASGNTAF